MRFALRGIVLALVACLAPALTSQAAQARDQVTVFGAASLTDALTELGKVYEERTGVAVRLSFASSSTLAQQIDAGAPAQIYVSADETWMDYLAGRDRIVAATRISPIGNSLVLIAPATSTLDQVAIVPGVDLAALLGTDGRLALGDPDHVPAGIYAREALTSLGLWDSLEPRLARADNVRSALALVALGEVPLGIVYGTDARISKDVKIVGVFPEQSHTPVSYPFAIVAGQESPAVDALFAFMTSDEGLAIFESYGFTRR